MPSRVKPSNAIFGQRLRQARQRRNLAQDELGVLAGLEESSSSARMSRYESGIHEPPFRFVEAVSGVLEISPAYFYCGDDRLADIILLYSAMTDEDRKALHDAACEIVRHEPG